MLAVAEKLDRPWRARPYNPMIGRWLSQDRLGMDGQDENFYRYVSNKALSSTDLTGTRIYFGDSYSAQVYRPLLDLIYSSSQAGQSLISKLDRASDEYYLWASDSIQGSPFDPGFSIRVYGGGEVCTNPNPTGQFQSTNGPVDLSAARVLAHELGHLTGVKDDGFMNMNNVVKFENPIMTPIDKQTRVTYP